MNGHLKIQSVETRMVIALTKQLYLKSLRRGLLRQLTEDLGLVLIIGIFLSPNSEHKEGHLLNFYPGLTLRARD